MNNVRFSELGANKVGKNFRFCKVYKFPWKKQSTSNKETDSDTTYLCEVFMGKLKNSWEKKVLNLRTEYLGK